MPTSANTNDGSPQATRPQRVRAYDSSGRRSRAADSRRRVVAAAAELFVAQGFAGTTIVQIARAAGVSTPTVYAGFATKAALLKRCVDEALAGDDADEPVAERPLARWVRAASDPRELLGRYAVMMGVLAERSGPIYAVLVRSADAVPELAELLADLEAQRLRAAGMLAAALVELRGGAVGSGPEATGGRSVEQMRDILWMCNAPELYATLTSKRGWSTDQYVEWSRNALIKLVLEPDVEGPVPSRADA